MAKKPKGMWKANQFDWDRITSLSAAECCFSLSQQEIAIILTYTEMIGWLRRWYSEAGEEIDFSVIETFKNQLEYKLMSGCCPDDDAIYRYTTEGIYERSTDGGDTWEPAPDDDPRNDWVLAPSLPGDDGTGKKCASANNNVAQFTIWANDLIELLEGGTVVTAIIAAIVGFIASVFFASGVGAAWGVLLFSFAAAIFAEGADAFDDAMTEEVYDDFKCILFCNMNEDGTFTEPQVLDILAEITANFTGLAQHFFYSIVSTMRWQGLSNTGTLGEPTATGCGDCECDEGCSVIYDVWSPLHGIILERGNDYIIAQSTDPGNGVGYIILVSETLGECCQFLSVETISGTYNIGYKMSCGTPYNEISWSAPLSIGCWQNIQLQSTVGSVLKINFSPCA